MMPESSWEGDHRTRLRLGIALETKKRWFRDTIQVPCLQNNLCVIRRTAILWLIMVLERVSMPTPGSRRSGLPVK